YHEGDVIHDTHQQVDLILMTHRTFPVVELIFPHGMRPTPVDKLLAQAPWVMYHLCYEVQSIEKTLKQWSLWSTLLKKPTPAVLFGGRRVAFIKLDSGLVLEF